MDSASRMVNVMFEVRIERNRQIEQWGDQVHVNGTGDPSWGHRANRAKAIFAEYQNGDPEQIPWQLILEEEVCEAFAESDDARLREELVQVAAVACAWIEDIDRRNDKQDSVALTKGRR